MRERKRIRKLNYDYSQDGWYFVTTNTRNHEHWFGEIQDNKMNLNEFGLIVQNAWLDLPNHYLNCVLDEFIIMPNHFHGIIEINNSSLGGGFKPPRPDMEKSKIHGLPEMIRAFKSFSSRRINENSKNVFRWHRSFHDRIIRNEAEYIRIKNYIQKPVVFRIVNWSLLIANCTLSLLAWN